MKYSVCSCFKIVLIGFAKLDIEENNHSAIKSRYYRKQSFYNKKIVIVPLLYKHSICGVQRYNRNEISLAWMARERKFRRRIMPCYILYSTYVLLVCFGFIFDEIASGYLRKKANTQLHYRQTQHAMTECGETAVRRHATSPW